MGVEERRATTAREKFEVACSSGSRLEMCSAAATPVRGREDFPLFSLSLFYADGGRWWEEAATPRAGEVPEAGEMNWAEEARLGKNKCKPSVSH